MTKTLEERAEARPPCGDCCFGGYCVDCMAAFAREELERRAAMVNRGFVIDFLRTCKDKAGKEGRYRGGGFTNDDVVEFGRYLLAARLGEEATP